MYHSISTRIDRLTVAPSMFANQMSILAEYHFDVISLREAYRRLETNGNLKRTIAITFDDGYRDFLTTASPILKKHSFPATLFVTGTQYQAGAGFLTHSELSEVRAMGFALGSHTMTHPNLTLLDDKALARELSDSRTYIGELGEKFMPFAYPGGVFTCRVRNAVMRAGYDCAVIVGGRWGNGAETDRFLLKREPMLASDTLERFKQRVSGFYEFYYLWLKVRGVKTR